MSKPIRAGGVGSNKVAVYVLRSLRDGKCYVGLSRDIEVRLGQHNAGKVRATKSRTPFVHAYFEWCDSLQEAREREKYFKTAAGRRFLDKHEGWGFPARPND